MRKRPLEIVCTGALCLLPTPGPAVGADCANWNTHAFFKTATPKAVTACLDAGADPTARDKGGGTPLHRSAAFNKNPAVLTTLLTAGADPNARGKYGVTPLHTAAAFNKTPAILTALLTAGADPNARDKYGVTPLHTAAAFNKTPAILTALLTAGADPNARGKFKSQLVYDSYELFAAEATQKISVEPSLLEDPPVQASREHQPPPRKRLTMPPPPTAELDAPPVQAAPPQDDLSSYDTPLVREFYGTFQSELGYDSYDEFLETVPQHWKRDRTLFSRMQQEVEEAKKYPPAKQDGTRDKLHVGFYNTFRKDLGAGMTFDDFEQRIAQFAEQDPNVRNRMANELYDTYRGHMTRPEFNRQFGLRKYDYKDWYGGTPLHWAAARNPNPHVLTALLTAGATPNARTKSGDTPLHRAAESNQNPAVLVALLNAGADPNALTEDGQTTLHWAAARNPNPHVLTALLTAGADPNARTKGKGGDTPLHRAVEFNQNPAVLVALLNAGADPNARDKGGGTPLHTAAARNPNPDVLTILLNSGADPAARDKRGKAPWHYAERNEAIRDSDVYWRLNDGRF